ncbi:MAG: hypothetical protein AAF360_00030 [Pseudomonadota bacterium]
MITIVTAAVGATWTIKSTMAKNRAEIAKLAAQFIGFNAALEACPTQQMIEKRLREEREANEHRALEAMKSRDEVLLQMMNQMRSDLGMMLASYAAQTRETIVLLKHLQEQGRK